MANNKNVVAFAGCECFDLILYLSRLLAKLGNRVLVADHSGAKSLAAAAPEVKGLDITEDIVEYRDVDYTARTLDGETFLPYDDVLLNCGMCLPAIDTGAIGRVVYVTDLYHFNIKRLAALSCYDGLGSEQSLIIRDVVRMGSPVQVVIAALNKDISPERVTILYRDDSDYENSLLLSSGRTVDFGRISPSLRELLLGEARLLHPEVPEKELKAAYKLARKGV